MPIAGAFLFCILHSAFCISAPPAPPATQPSSDPTVDWLLQQSSPSTQPIQDATATKGQKPFNDKNDPNVRHGTLTLSDGKKITGQITTTEGKPIRVWVESEKEYHDLPFNLIKSVEAKVLWERQEKQWHFKDSGSDIKEYDGKSYPARETEYTITLVNGQSVSGGVVAPIYFVNETVDKTFVLHKRDKGETGQTLEQLVYIKKLELE